ncbi:hypothetical protein [Aestuariicoccus sp. MJ-SS9]|uniref:hypothetical protein n=1 Tax=Aestuariicoccus sp. MJ-SS9 TaxID=3079855 RepID=UPI00290DCBBE|nr:hypothetical protein [Aestuariicoccus sp. MJ-SS9]MDU8910060.1 hypothetical protein [Aestuariicoccus sp. MJ-SS9]
MTDRLTVLESTAGIRQSKRFWGTAYTPSFQVSEKFRVSTLDVSDVKTLGDAVQFLAKQPTKVVIRGHYDGRLDQPVRRRKEHFSAESRQWCMIDIDSLPWDGDLQDQDAMLRYAASQLPAEFQNTDCWYHFSSSMGIKSGIRVHLWYWLERPCSDEEMKAWLTGCAVDLSLFNPLQMHLTSNPQFIEGATDPFPKRSGFFRAGKGIIVVPVPTDLQARSEAIQRTSNPRHRTQAGTLDPEGIVRDPDTGLAINGREQLMFLLSNEVMRDLVKDDYQPTEDEVTEELWQRFSQEADLTVVSDRGVWTEAHAGTKARARLKELAEGKYSFVSRADNTTLLAGSGQVERPKLVSGEAAQTELNEILDSFFDRLGKGEKPRASVRLTMGTGKTTQTIDHLKAFLKDRGGQSIEVYVPRHDLASEWQEKLSGVNAEVIHIYPRTGGKFDSAKESYPHPIKCDRADYVRDLEDKGHSIYSNACLSRDSGVRCSFFGTCNYLNQFRNDDSSATNKVRIYTHASLFLNRNEFEREQSPDLVIIDEAFMASAVGNMPSVSTNDVIQYVRSDDCTSLGFELIECLSNHQGNLRYLREKGIGAADFQSVSLEQLNQKPAFETDQAQSRNVGSVKLFKALDRLIELAAREIEDQSQEHFEQLIYEGNRSEVVVCEHKPSRVPRTTSVLYLDATADPIITEPYLPELKPYRIDVWQRAVVSQVYDRTGSNSFWNEKIEKEKQNLRASEYDERDNDLASLIVILNEWSRVGEKPLLVGHMGLCDFVKVHPNLGEGVDVAHFMSLRGTDTYKDNSVIFITGRNQPPLDAIDLQARAIFGNSGFPLAHDDTGDLPLSQVEYWLSERSPHPPSAAPVRSFSDPRIEAVQKQIREAETVQAIARLRLVWAKYQKRVFLLSNLPVEMPVDHLINFIDLMPDKLEMELIKRGDLPLDGLSLEKMRPDLGYSGAGARKLFQQGRSKAANPETLLFCLPDLLMHGAQVATYKGRVDRWSPRKHLFLPKNFKQFLPDAGQDEGPFMATAHLWSPQEVQAHLEAGWGEGNVSDVELEFLLGPEVSAERDR